MSDEATKPNERPDPSRPLIFQKNRAGKVILKDSIDSSHSDSTTLNVGVFPAHAGVFLPVHIYLKLLWGIPRSRGGVFPVLFLGA